jgi:sulfhydrogenase subunit beta (sulfur reductase)
MTVDGFLARADLQRLIDALKASHRNVIGPVVRDGALVYDTIERASQLPTGWRDEQAPGRYRLTQTASPRCFAFAVGAQGLKPLTFAPRESLWRTERNQRGELKFTEVVPPVKPTAVIGVRACDLAALHLQDQHFAYGEYADAYFNQRRRALFIVAVDCAQPAATCFCASTGDGPAVTSGFDLALTELDEGFIVTARSDAGRTLVDGLPLVPVTEDQRGRAASEHQAAVAAQTRTLPGRDLNAALFAQLQHPRWKDVGDRCLACGNCTAVCPTCFCHGETSVAAPDGTSAEHVRQWDSCFAAGHSYIHGWVVRGSTDLRYRQWLTHKLGSWHDQYGRSGCTGCGRCITWCPVGIDITEEAAAIVGTPQDHARP